MKGLHQNNIRQHQSRHPANLGTQADRRTHQTYRQTDIQNRTDKVEATFQVLILGRFVFATCHNNVDNITATTE